MKYLRHLGILCGLALAVVLGQHAAVLHDLGHVTGQWSHRQDSKPAPTKCDECGLAAELSSALGTTAIAVPFVASVSPRPVARPDLGVHTATRIAFESRAPPTLL